MKTGIADVTVVVPLLNEKESLQELYDRIKKVSTDHSIKTEIIFVDDGSNDGSFEVIEKIAGNDKNVKVFQFQRNFGKSAALSLGFKKATGKYVVTMDADLQDDPDEIPNLIKKIEDGYGVVSGWKRKRHDPITKRFPSKLWNRAISIITGINIHDFNCGLKIYRNEVVKSVRVYGELHRYIPVLAKSQGFTVSEIEVKHHARKFGKTKFGVSRFLKGIFDLITILFLGKFLMRPLHFFGLVGLFFFSLGFSIDFYLTVKWFMGEGIGHRPLLFLGILLILLGIQFGSIGLIGEMITILRIDKHQYQLKREISNSDEE